MIQQLLLQSLHLCKAVKYVHEHGGFFWIQLHMLLRGKVLILLKYVMSHYVSFSSN